MAGTPSSGIDADAEAEGLEGDDGEDGEDTPPLPDLLQRLPGLVFERELPAGNQSAAGGGSSSSGTGGSGAHEPRAPAQDGLTWPLLAPHPYPLTIAAEGDLPPSVLLAPLAA
jgi:hypothetical protein